MPTARPRHTVTESYQVTRALDAAAEHWPEHRAARGKLLVRLVQEGHRAISGQHADQVVRHQEALERTRGALTGAYEPGYLARLRDEWQE